MVRPRLLCACGALTVRMEWEAGPEAHKNSHTKTMAGPLQNVNAGQFDLTIFILKSKLSTECFSDIKI